MTGDVTVEEETDWPSLEADLSGDVVRVVVALRRGNREGRGKAEGRTDREKVVDSSMSRDMT